MERRSIDLPFRFAGRDLAAAEGHRLRIAQVRNVALTEPTELPWRSRFGAGLDRVRHRRLNDVLVELVRVRLRDALRLWAPSVELGAVSAKQSGESLLLHVSVRNRETGETFNVEFRL
jgi:phage baseplate assembly protein W